MLLSIPFVSHALSPIRSCCADHQRQDWLTHKQLCKSLKAHNDDAAAKFPIPAAGFVFAPTAWAIRTTLSSQDLEVCRSDRPPALTKWLLARWDDLKKDLR